MGLSREAVSSISTFPSSTFKVQASDEALHELNDSSITPFRFKETANRPDS